MAVITPVPLYISNATLKVASDNYEAAVSSVTLTPSTDVATFKGLTPAAVFKRSSNAEWVCEIVYAQDWKTAGSLSNYLLNHAGETAAVTFVPDVGGPTISVTVVLAPGAIGGAVDSYATATVSLGVNGQPTVTPAS